jgi:hypothetical protein
MTNYEPLNEKKFKEILRTILLHLGINELDNTLNKIFNIISKLEPKILDEIVLNIDNEMIAKLKKVNQLFGELTTNTIIDKSYRVKWQTLLFDTAKLQGLLIVKRIKKLVIDPSNKNKEKLVNELNNGIKSRDSILNNILINGKDIRSFNKVNQNIESYRPFHFGNSSFPNKYPPNKNNNLSQSNSPRSQSNSPRSQSNSPRSQSNSPRSQSNSPRSQSNPSKFNQNNYPPRPPTMPDKINRDYNFKQSDQNEYLLPPPQLNLPIKSELGNTISYLNNGLSRRK